MNLSVPPSSLLAPAPPDFYHCSQFYSQKFVPDYEDCDIAIGLLPSGNAPIPWYLDPLRGDPENLSYTATHGTCQLQMQIAGQDADGSRQNWISGNFMRQMARLVMDKCIIASITGGYLTRGFSKQLEYVTSPKTTYENAFPPSTAFLTMMVRDSGSDDNGYSPGDQDPYTGQLLIDALEATVYLTPATSSARNNLQRNLDHWYETVRNMDGTRDWWQDVPQMNGNPTGAAALTNLIVNKTFACGESVKGVTSLPRACL
ncbi:MAG: hypothetical protein ASARMPREDX12_005394 [Alectoria sarmentosa]|nr:MAG: hypothetical protein ASARMPREDX12_005394 [Alectoria sarmentosa]